MSRELDAEVEKVKINTKPITMAQAYTKLMLWGKTMNYINRAYNRKG